MNRLIALSLVLLMSLPSLPLAAFNGGSTGAAAPRASPVKFTNVTSAAGLGGLLGDSYAWGDYNNDGYDDLLVKGNRLFRNNGPPNYDFTEVTSQVGIGTAYGYAVWGDYNNDGYLDFFCAGQDETQRDSLWRNAGPPNYDFINASKEAGGMDDGLKPSIAPAWLDYDRDGFLDIYVVNWRDAAGTCYPDVLWHNNRDGTFSQVTAQAGIVDWNSATGAPNAGMGVDCADYNNDGWPDIFVGNYLLGNNYLFHNNHDGTFSDFGPAAYANVSGTPKYYIDGTGPYYGHTAGSCWGDYNNDGNLDLWVGNLAHKDMGTTMRATICDNPMLMKNLGFPYTFEDFKERAGMPNIPNGDIMDGQWHDDDTFGGAWCDFDNDGWLDLYVPQVKTYHSWAFAELWHNNGDGTFTEVGDDAGIRLWAGIGCAWADYNNDGAPDFVSEGQYPYQGPRECHLMMNQGTANSWLKVHLTGTVSNRAAIGARVTVSDGATTQIREVEGGTGGHAHQSSLTQMFGFGSYPGKVSVEIRWPSGIIQNITGVPLDQRINITEDAQAPDIEFVTPTKTSIGEGENVTIKYGFKFGADSDYTIAWDFEGDGKFDVFQDPPGPNPVVSYPRPGIYYPKLRVMNKAGTRGCEESAIIYVHDVPPVAHAGGDRVANETERMVFDASSSTGAPCDIPNFTYNWSFNDGWTTGWLKSPVLVRSFNQSGPYTATLGVRDDEGSTSNDSIGIRVLNLPPTVAVAMSPMAVEDTPATFDAVGNDTAPDLPFLRFQWDFGDNTGPSQVLVSPKCKHTYTQAGDFLATVTVTDDDGAKSNASFEITVANVPPTGITELSEVAADEDAPLTLTGTGQDTPSDLASLAYRWDLGDGNSTDWGPDASATHAYTMSGNYTAVFFVRDRYNATADATVNVTVRNLPPKCSISTEDQETTEDSAVSFDGAGRDTPTDMLTLSYRWDFGDGNLTGWAVDTSAEHAYAQKGTYDAALTVRDNDGAEASSTVEVTVDNVPPVARARASGTNVDEDAPVVFNATGSSDTPSDIPLLAFSWDFGDGHGAEGAVANHNYSKQRTYTVVLTVTDDDGATSTAELRVKVNNVAPSLEVSADRMRAPVGTAFVLGAAANDTESDLPVLKYEWNFGDLSTALGKNVTHAYAAPGHYTVTAKVTDDEGGVAEQKLVVEVYEPEKPPAPANGYPSATIIGAAAGAVAAVAVAAGIVFIIRRRKPPAKEGGPEGPPVAANKSAPGK